jgi:hypothetical protein
MNLVGKKNFLMHASKKYANLPRKQKNIIFKKIVDKIQKLIVK